MHDASALSIFMNGFALTFITQLDDIDGSPLPLLDNTINWSGVTKVFSKEAIDVAKEKKQNSETQEKWVSAFLIDVIFYVTKAVLVVSTIVLPITFMLLVEVPEAPVAAACSAPAAAQ